MANRKTDPKKHCLSCGGRMYRRTMSGRLEDLAVFRRRRFCDMTCYRKRTLGAVGKHGHMYRARKLRGPCCEKCGATNRLHAHHKDRDWKNDAPSNIVTLCPTCHRRLHWQEDGQRARRRSKRLVWVTALDRLRAAAARLPVGSKIRTLVSSLTAGATATTSTGTESSGMAS